MRMWHINQVYHVLLVEINACTGAVHLPDMIKKVERERENAYVNYKSNL